MLFSIIIPLVTINNYIKETVGYILELNYHEWELIIVTNDAEPNIWEDPRIRLIHSGKVAPGRKRDLGARSCNGDILVFLDDDSYPSKDYLSKAKNYFESDQILAIGGPGVTPESDSFWQKVSGATFLTDISGGVAERYIPKGEKKYVEDWPSVNFLIRKELFLAIGGFNTDYWPGEDSELCKKIISYEKKIYYIPDLLVFHHRRAGVVNHIKQIHGYGLHRGFLAKSGSKNSQNLKYAIPSLSIIILLVIVLFTMIFDTDILFLNFMLMSYVLILCYGFIQIFRLTPFLVSFCAIPYIVLTHMIYGVAYLRGIFKTKLTSELR